MAPSWTRDEACIKVYDAIAKVTGRQLAFITQYGEERTWEALRMTHEQLRALWAEFFVPCQGDIPPLPPTIGGLIDELMLSRR